MGKTTRRAAAVEAPAQHDEQAQPDEHTPVQQDAAAEIQTPAPAAAKRRRSQQPLAPIELEAEFINNPQRMQYALLLALLLRQKGTAKFSRKDMAPVDTDYNILFARTLDGNFLEVSVVSAESGIIRSPEKQKELDKWNNNQNAAVDVRTPSFEPMPADSGVSDHPADVFFRLHGMTAPPGLTVQAPPPQAPPATAPSSTPAGQVLTFPPTGETTAPAPPPPVQANQPSAENPRLAFPFQTGDRPETATDFTLANAMTRLMNQDQQVQQSEAAAIERQERGE